MKLYIHRLIGSHLIGSDRFSGLVKCDKAKQQAFKVQWHCGFWASLP